MKIFEALNFAKNIFQERAIETASLDAMVLLGYATSFSKEQIVFNPNQELTKEQRDNFENAVNLRATRIPVSHIIGKREFYGLDFFVNSFVLDPRADSESLIEMVFERFLDKNQKLKIAEIGVGSGCLIITLLKYFQNIAAIGVDISDKALEVALKNAKTHQVENRLQLIKSDLFEKLDESQKFDFIISNPPYIAKAEIETLAEEVRLHEPRLALDGGVDGLDFYRRIAASCKNFLTPQGLIFLEIGQGQGRQIVDIFVNIGFEFKGSKADLARVERVLCFGVLS